MFFKLKVSKLKPFFLRIRLGINIIIMTFSSTQSTITNTILLQQMIIDTFLDFEKYRFMRITPLILAKSQVRTWYLRANEDQTFTTQ